jgi:hypothetical protein
MKTKPLYAALDLHSGTSVLGSMDHDGKSEGQVRFATGGQALREQVLGLARGGSADRSI